MVFRVDHNFKQRINFVFEICIEQIVGNNLKQNDTTNMFEHLLFECVLLEAELSRNGCDVLHDAN